MAYEELKNHGVTANTPKNIFFGAGTIHKGLIKTEGVWNFAESLIGATSGGTKVSIVPDMKDIELDGASVKVKGLTIKVGEKATMDTNLAEITPEIMTIATLGASEASETAGYTKISSGGQLTTGSYVENLGFVGKTLDGTPIIVIFENALCTSGLELEGKNKDNGVIKLTFECYATIEQVDLDHLPWTIETKTPA